MELSVLVERLKADDEDARAHLWTHYWDLVFGRCLKVLHNKADAADVAVDVLTDFMFKRVYKLSEPKAMRSYLRLAAVRRALKWRDMRDRNSSMGDEVMADPTDRSASYEVSAMMPKVSACLSELSPKAIQVIRLRFGQEMTNEKIGKLVGGSKQYIGQLLARSLKALAKCLEANGGGG